ncbi:hypothetical protein SKAU_G00265600 [Synaphobranchus kaupii]|uniref:Uncharacterized protein n=1 Tax=Synaphobranchus kaupii TaxID=118154 RepID=A0A9Q1IQ27_SYNKA|nr:hypothetical protein SKAU_G00265600 [Synaphobranchus kaupii]
MRAYELFDDVRAPLTGFGTNFNLDGCFKMENFNAECFKARAVLCRGRTDSGQTQCFSCRKGYLEQCGQGLALSFCFQVSFCFTITSDSADGSLALGTGFADNGRRQSHSPLQVAPERTPKGCLALPHSRPSNPRPNLSQSFLSANYRISNLQTVQACWSPAAGSGETTTCGWTKNERFRRMDRWTLPPMLRALPVQPDRVEIQSHTVPAKGE